MQPSHLLTDMNWAAARLGPERINYSYAWRSMLNHHITLAFGTDYPVESINPLRGLYAAITRQNEAGTATYQPQERISLSDAIYVPTPRPRPSPSSASTPRAASNPASSPTSSSWTATSPRPARPRSNFSTPVSCALSSTAKPCTPPPNPESCLSVPKLPEIPILFPILRV